MENYKNYPWHDKKYWILMLIVLWITCENVESVAICTITFVQHFVENLLKVLKLLKTTICSQLAIKGQSGRHSR